MEDEERHLRKSRVAVDEIFDLAEEAAELLEEGRIVEAAARLRLVERRASEAAGALGMLVDEAG